MRQRDQLAQPARAVDGQRPLAAAQVERLEQARQAEPVVGVEVGQEHLGQLGQPDRAARAGAGSPRRSRTGSGRRRGAPAPPAARAGRSGSSRRCRRRKPRGPSRPQSVSRAPISSNSPARAARVAMPIVCCGRAAALGRAPRVEDLKPVRRRARAAGCASARTRPRRRRGTAGAAAPAVRSAGPASWTSPILAPPASTERAGRQRRPHLGVVDVAVDGDHAVRRTRAPGAPTGGSSRPRGGSGRPSAAAPRTPRAAGERRAAGACPR